MDRKPTVAAGDTGTDLAALVARIPRPASLKDLTGARKLLESLRWTNEAVSAITAAEPSVDPAAVLRAVVVDGLGIGWETFKANRATVARGEPLAEQYSSFERFQPKSNARPAPSVNEYKAALDHHDLCRHDLATCKFGKALLAFHGYKVGRGSNTEPKRSMPPLPSTLDRSHADWEDWHTFVAFYESNGGIEVKPKVTGGKRAAEGAESSGKKAKK